VTHFASLRMWIVRDTGGGRGLGARGRRGAAGSGAAGVGGEDRSEGVVVFSIIFLETPRTRLLWVAFSIYRFYFPEKEGKSDSVKQC
jgi:hypothetical protein